MPITDSIGDLLTTIRNANSKKLESIDVPASNMKKKLIEILREEGYITSFEDVEIDGKKILRIKMKYRTDGLHVLHEIERKSKPGRRIYVHRREIPKVKNGIGISIVTTPKGVMTGHEARKQNTGGELICTVW